MKNKNQTSGAPGKSSLSLNDNVAVGVIVVVVVHGAYSAKARTGGQIRCGWDRATRSRKHIFNCDRRWNERCPNAEVFLKLGCSGKLSGRGQHKINNGGEKTKTKQTIRNSSLSTPGNVPFHPCF